MYSGKNRLMFIQDILNGAINLYPSDKVSLYPILDCLHLLIQKPIVISFLRKSSSNVQPYEDIYTTLQDPELKSYFEKSVKCNDPKLENTTVEIPDTPFFARLSEIKVSGDIKNTTFHPVDPYNFKNLLDGLKNDESHQGCQVLEKIKNGLEGMESALTSHTPENTEKKVNGLPEKELAGTDIPSLLEPMRRVIDDSCANIMLSPLMRKLNGEDLPFSNLFCVIRTATINTLRRGHFDYTARLLLSNSQKQEINKWAKPASCRNKHCNRKPTKCLLKSLDYNSEELCKRLEFPLGDNARSIADSVFHNGVIDFSAEVAGEGRDYPGQDKNSSDRLRQHAERCVYSQITDEQHILYIPVHVDGVPWLALLTFTSLHQDVSSWAHHYQVYRLVPQIAEKLRKETERAYLKLIGERFAIHLEDTHSATLLDSVNKSWKQLIYVYPFPQVELKNTQHDDSMPLELPDGRKVWLRMLESNPNFERQVNYGLLEVDSVARECENVLLRAKEEKIKIDRFERILSPLIRHDYGNFRANTESAAQLCLGDIENVPPLLDCTRLRLKELLSKSMLASIALRGMSIWLKHNRLKEKPLVSIDYIVQDLSCLNSKERPVEVNCSSDLQTHKIPVILTAVLAELIRNAWKEIESISADDKKVKVTFGSEDHLMMQVINSGSLGALKSILNDANRPQPKSGGSGTWVCKEIVQALGGTIKWDEHEQKVIVTIQIPFSKEEG